MMYASFSYRDEDGILIGGTFVCNKTVQQIIDGQSYTFYATNIGKRTIIHYTRGDNAYGVVEVNGIKYYTDSKGRLDYDITDELRVVYEQNPQGFLFIGEPAIRIMPLAGIDVEAALMPAPPQLAGLSLNVKNILPPSVIYQHPTMGKRFEQLYEIAGDYGEDSDWQGRMSNGGLCALYFSGTDERTLVVPTKDKDGNTDYCVRFHSDNLANEWNLILLRECDNVCVLRWLSETGETRQTMWRVKKITKNGEAIDLMPIGDNYKQERSESVEITAYIEGLDAYSYAYYGDIVFGKNVHCAINWFDDLAADDTEVAVITNGVTLPDGDSGELQTLEIKIAYKHYDAI